MEHKIRKTEREKHQREKQFEKLFKKVIRRLKLLDDIPQTLEEYIELERLNAIAHPNRKLFCFWRHCFTNYDEIVNSFGEYSNSFYRSQYHRGLLHDAATQLVCRHLTKIGYYGSELAVDRRTGQGLPNKEKNSEILHI